MKLACEVVLGWLYLQFSVVLRFGWFSFVAWPGVGVLRGLCGLCLWLLVVDCWRFQVCLVWVDLFGCDARSGYYVNSVVLILYLN